MTPHLEKLLKHAANYKEYRQTPELFADENPTRSIDDYDTLDDLIDEAKRLLS